MMIPESCMKWLKLQRSGYVNHRQEFIGALTHEFETLKDYLPEECTTVLDIGCGIAGIDVFLGLHYQSPYFYLLDNSATSVKPIYGYDRGKSFYNSFQATIDMMQMNSIQDFQIIDIANGLPGPLINIKPHLIISLLSWGYHFPVSEYLEQAHEILAPGGRVILDIRNGTDGIEVLNTRFDNIVPIVEENKAVRVCAW